MKRLAWILAAASLLGGCANGNSIWRNQPVISGGGYSARAISLDARQRLAWTALGPEGIRICAEQAPDVFAVLSASLAAQGSSSLVPPNRDVSAQIAAAMSEQASTISRTQTVNLLAQSFYRTCERWLSGAIDEDEFKIQSMRDQRAMMVVLTVEQLTGAVRPAPTIITAGGASATNDNGYAETLTAAKKAADAGAANRAKAQEAYDLALKEAPEPAAGASRTCDAIADEAKKTACKGSKSELDKADAAAKREEAQYQALLKAAPASGGASVAGGSPATTTVQASGVSSEALMKVADVVKEVVLKGMDFPERDAICSVIIRNGPPGTPGQASTTEVRDIYARCLEQYVSASGGSAPERPAGIGIRGATESAGAQLSARLFVQSPRADVGAATALVAAMRGAPGLGGLNLYAVEGVAAENVPAQTEVRYFHPEDRGAARLVSARLANSFGAPPRCRLVPGYAERQSVRRGLLELWTANGETIRPVVREGAPGAGC